MEATTQHIDTDHFFTALDQCYADSWEPDSRYCDDNGWVAISESIDTEWDGEMDKYRGAVLSFIMRHTVVTDEPHYYEGYAEYEGTITYEGRTYEFYHDTYSQPDSWKEV